MQTRFVSSNDDAGARVGYKVVAKGPGKLVSLLVYNAGPQQYIQLHFLDSLPVNGTRPSFPNMLVPANTLVSVELGAHGLDVDKLVVTNSTSAPTLTAGAADCEFFAVFQS